MCYDTMGASNAQIRATGRQTAPLGSPTTRMPQNGLTARKLALPNAVLNKPTRRAVNIEPKKPL